MDVFESLHQLLEQLIDDDPVKPFGACFVYPLPKRLTLRILHQNHNVQAGEWLLLVNKLIERRFWLAVARFRLIFTLTAVWFASRVISCWMETSGIWIWLRVGVFVYLVTVLFILGIQFLVLFDIEFPFAIVVVPLFDAVMHAEILPVCKTSRSSFQLLRLYSIYSCCVWLGCLHPAAFVADNILMLQLRNRFDLFHCRMRK